MSCTSGVPGRPASLGAGSERRAAQGLAIRMDTEHAVQPSPRGPATAVCAYRPERGGAAGWRGWELSVDLDCPALVPFNARESQVSR